MYRSCQHQTRAFGAQLSFPRGARQCRPGKEMGMSISITFQIFERGVSPSPRVKIRLTVYCSLQYWCRRNSSSTKRAHICKKNCHFEVDCDSCAELRIKMCNTQNSQNILKFARKLLWRRFLLIILRPWY